MYSLEPKLISRRICHTLSKKEESVIRCHYMILKALRINIAVMFMAAKYLRNLRDAGCLFEPSVWNESKGAEDGRRHETKEGTTAPVRGGALGAGGDLLRELELMPQFLVLVSELHHRHALRSYPPWRAG